MPSCRKRAASERSTFGPVSADTAAWLGTLTAELHARFVKVGLAARREAAAETATVGLDAFLDQEHERYRGQLEKYAEVLMKLDKRPVKLGLYFPLLGGWREWGVV